MPYDDRALHWRSPLDEEQWALDVIEQLIGLDPYGVFVSFVFACDAPGTKGSLRWSGDRGHVRFGGGRTLDMIEIMDMSWTGVAGEMAVSGRRLPSCFPQLAGEGTDVCVAVYGPSEFERQVRDPSSLYGPDIELITSDYLPDEAPASHARRSRYMRGERRKPQPFGGEDARPLVPYAALSAGTTRTRRVVNGTSTTSEDTLV